jgi:hypothetical protein
MTDGKQRTFSLVFTDTELSLIILALWREEHRQLRLAAMSEEQGRSEESIARRENASKAMQLSERLSIIGTAGRGD